jgi:hypothetical protein
MGASLLEALQNIGRRGPRAGSETFGFQSFRDPVGTGFGIQGVERGLGSRFFGLSLAQAFQRLFGLSQGTLLGRAMPRQIRPEAAHGLGGFRDPAAALEITQA